MRYTTLVFGLLLPMATMAGGASTLGPMFELKLSDKTIEGTAVSWTPRTVHMLGRDGRMWEVDPNEVLDFRRTAPAFRSFSAASVRNLVLREFGSGFEVTGTGHYLVAHPQGERDLWSRRFEDLYRSFWHYFRARGFQLEEPKFPLVAVVWKNREDFFRSAASEGVPLGPGVLGYYSLATNRIMLYDVTRGRADSQAWHINAETIIHEATHQTAFNAGIHTRFASAPAWVVEGLGTLFEAPGVWNGQMHRNRSDRVNRNQLAAFKTYLKRGRKSGASTQLVSSDRIFRYNVHAAYAESWALTFYLMETQPAKYAKYLRRTNAREPFTDYSSTDRLADFQAVFGGDTKMFEAHFLRFINSIK